MNKREVDFTPKKHLPEALLPKRPEVTVLPPRKDDRYLYINDICAILGCGRNKAYKVIAALQEKLPDRGITEPPGRISKEYFMEHLFMGAPGKEGSNGTTEY